MPTSLINKYNLGPEKLANVANFQNAHMRPEFFIQRAKWLEDPEDNQKYSKWMKSIFDKGIQINTLRMQMQSYKLDGSINAINHLDLWFNNILAKYGNNDKLEDVLVLDFQTSGYCNVANDLAQFLFSSTTKEFRDQHLDYVLDYYLNELKSVVRNAGGKEIK